MIKQHLILYKRGLGTTNMYEQLTVEVESQLGDISNNGEFYVLRTETGWSFDDASELMEIIKKVKNVIMN